MDALRLAEGTPEEIPDSMVFVCGDPEQHIKLARLLRRAVGEVALTGSLDDIKGHDRYGLIAVHYDSLSEGDQRYLVESFADRAERPTLLLLSEQFARRDFAELFGSRTLTNMLVLGDTGPDISDLLVTVQKIRKHEIFGIEKYFVWGIQPVSVLVNRSTQKPEVLDAVDAYTERIGIQGRLRGLIHTVTDEFLTNAIYNAPVQADGTPRHADRPRTDPVELLQGEQVQVRFCCDGRRFGISTTDPFGSLSPTRLQDYLARAYRSGGDEMNEGSGGAGLGFYQILDSLTHFVVNIEPGVRTEMIGLINVSGSYRSFAAHGKSFNIFVKEA